jgi:hypothetical protein
VLPEWSRFINRTPNKTKGRDAVPAFVKSFCKMNIKHFLVDRDIGPAQAVLAFIKFGWERIVVMTGHALASVPSLERWRVSILHQGSGLFDLRP